MKEYTGLFTVRRVMKIFLYVILLGFFCPVFMVSCGGVGSKEVSAMDIATGIKIGGYDVVDPMPIVFISLLLPLIALVFLYLRKYADKMVSAVTTACTGINMVSWMIYIYQANKIKSSGYASVKFTGWLYINVISMIVVIALSIMAVLGKFRLDSDLVRYLSGGSAALNMGSLAGSARSAAGKVSTFAGELSRSGGGTPVRRNPGGYCHNCGSPLVKGNLFCSNCGARVMDASDIKPETKKAPSPSISNAEKPAVSVKHAKKDSSGTSGFHTPGDL